MKYKIYKEKDSDKIFYGIVENESIAMLISLAFKETLHWDITFEPYNEEIDEEELNKLAEESWDNLRKFASAQHVVDGWNNYVYGFKSGYRKAKNE